MALRRPGVSDIILDQVALGWTILFTCELVIKVIALGAFQGLSAEENNTYLADGWNKLDGAVVLFSWVSIMSKTRWIAASRAMRGLRLVARSRNTRIVVNSLIEAFPGIINVMLFSILFYWVFGILFVNLFKGQFHYCINCPDIDPISLEYPDFFTDLNYPFVCKELSRQKCDFLNGTKWFKPFSNFDNIFAAFITLTEVTSFTGWSVIQERAMYTHGVEQGWSSDIAKPWVPMVFILVILVIGFGVLNLFVGTVVDTFSELKKEFDGSALLSPEQQEWMFYQRLINLITLNGIGKKPKNPIRAILHTIVSHRYFDYLVIMVILLNTMVLAMTSNELSELYGTFVTTMNGCFVWFFGLEAIIKILGMGWTMYWQKNWNRLDFIVTILSFATLISTYFNAPSYSVISVARIFRLVGRVPSLKRYFSTLIDTLPMMANIISLLICVLYIFTIMGVSLFGTIKHTDDGLSPEANFESFQNALLTLIRCFTGDDWHAIRWGCAIQEENSSCKNTEDNCGDLFASNLFFFIFVIGVSLVFTELYTAVILEHFKDPNEALFQKIGKFTDIWCLSDVANCGVLSAKTFVDKVWPEANPYFTEGMKNRTIAMNVMRLCNLRCILSIDPYGDPKKIVYCVRFQECILGLMEKIVTISGGSARTLGFVIAFGKKQNVKFSEFKNVPGKDQSISLFQWYAARTIQICFRKHINKKNSLNMMTIHS